MHAYQTPPGAEQQYRLHLRVEPGGTGLLIVNAATVVHLNETATEYAKLLIEGVDEEEAVRRIRKRYRVGTEQARADFANVRDNVITLATTVDLDPVTYLDMERVQPFSAGASAPYRLDLALTYCLDERDTVDPECAKRVERELSTDEWRQVLQHAWDVGIPHVTFTGGEPTLRPDLVELIRRAEDIGQVTGLITDGRRLADVAYLDALLQAGLDHLMVSLYSHEAAVHDAVVGLPGAWAQTVAGLRNAVAGDIYVVVQIGVLPQNAGAIEQTVDFVRELGAHAVALSSPIRLQAGADREGLAAALAHAQEVAQEHSLPVVADVPAPYSAVNPVELELEQPSGALGVQSLYVEPDGDVLPAQGYNVVLGNLLRDPWPTLWQHPELAKLREAHQP